MPETDVRKKTVRKTAAKSTKKTTARKSATKRTPKKTVTQTTTAPITKTTTTVARKAPTDIAAWNAAGTRAKRLYAVASVVFLVIIGVSVGIGYSDKGPIVVSEQFQKRLEAADESERKVIENITLPKPVDDKPLGGLVGTGKSPAPTPPPPAPTASSTEESATSTTESNVDEGTQTEEVSAEDSVAPSETIDEAPIEPESVDPSAQ